MVLCPTPEFVYELQCFQGNFTRVRTQEPITNRLLTHVTTVRDIGNPPLRLRHFPFNLEPR